MEEVRFADLSSPSLDSRSSHHTVRNEQQGWGDSHSQAGSDAFAGTSDPNAWFSTPAGRGDPNQSTLNREPYCRNNGTWGVNDSNSASSGGVQPRSGPKRPGFWKADGRWDSEAAARAHGPAAPSSEYSAEPSRPARKRRELIVEPSDPVGQRDYFAEPSRPVGRKNEFSTEWSRPIEQERVFSAELSHSVGNERVGREAHDPPVSPSPDTASHAWSDDKLGDRPTDTGTVPPNKQVKSIFPKTAGEKSLSESRWAVAAGTTGHDFGMQRRNKFQDRASGGYQKWSSSARQPNQGWDTKPQKVDSQKSKQQADTQTPVQGHSQSQGGDGNGWGGERTNGGGDDAGWDDSDAWSSKPRKVNSQQPQQQWVTQTPSKDHIQSKGSDGKDWGGEVNNAGEDEQQSWDNSDAWSAKTQKAESRQLKQQWNAQDPSSKGQGHGQGDDGNGWRGERNNGGGGQAGWDDSDAWSSKPRKVNSQQPQQQWVTQTPSKDRSQSQGSDGKDWGGEVNNAGEDEQQSWDNSDAWSAITQKAESRQLKQQWNAQDPSSKGQGHGQGDDGNGWRGERNNGGGGQAGWDDSDPWSTKPQKLEFRQPRQQLDTQDQSSKGQGHGQGGDGNGWGGERNNGGGGDAGWDDSDPWSTKPQKLEFRQPRQQLDTQDQSSKGQGQGQGGDGHGWGGEWNTGKDEDQSYDRGAGSSKTSREPWDQQQQDQGQNQEGQRGGDDQWGGGLNSGGGKDQNWDWGKAKSSNAPKERWDLKGQSHAQGQGEGIGNSEWGEDKNSSWGEQRSQKPPTDIPRQPNQPRDTDDQSQGRDCRGDNGRRGGWNNGGREDKSWVQLDARSSNPPREDSRQPNQQWDVQGQAQGLEGGDIGCGKREDPSSNSGNAKWSKPPKDSSRQRPDTQDQTQSQNRSQEGGNIGWEGGWNNRGRESRDWSRGETRSSRPPKGDSDQSWDRVEAKSSKSRREDSLQPSQQWDTQGPKQGQSDGEIGWGGGRNSSRGEDRISNSGEVKWSKPLKEDSRQQWNTPSQNQGHNRAQSGGDEWNNGGGEVLGWDNGEAKARKRGW